MKSFKNICLMYSIFIVRSRNALLFILAVSLLLNLVLFLQIPRDIKPQMVHTYSEELQIAELLEQNVQKHRLLGQNVQRLTNDTFQHQQIKKLDPFFLRQDKYQTTQRQSTTPLSPASTTQQPTSACPIMSIHKNKGEHFQDTVCRPHLPAEDACQFTAKMFKLQPSIAKCHDQRDPPHELCHVTEIRNGIQLSAPEVECDVTVCLKTAEINLLIIDTSDGNYLQLDLPGTVTNSRMKEVVKQGIVKTRENGFHFMFIDCTGRKNREKISQLLTFLPPEEIFKQKGEALKNKVNVNVVLLDSISRPHFFRSLRKTVAHLREKSEDPKYKAHLFDFELFQSVHGHTHENEHALFGGTLYPENFTKSDKDHAPTNMERLFGIFKDNGYQTMAQNDLCWKSWYGFLTSFMMQEWPELQKVIKQTIDSTGITDASCKILQRSKKTTTFSDDDDHQICYNGKHQHRYLFDHLTNYLKAVTTINSSKPLFSYTETNVAHDDVGIRVQTLDQDLTDLIDNLVQLPNTFTIIYADHGNTYTDYQISMLEGRLEMYHPIMLGILPKELGRKFGENVVENLKTNQHRLIHLFDIRESLVELANYDMRSRLKPVGIFKEISKNRTCDDLKLSTPNYCICDGWDVPVANSTAQVALAEFAIGQLNNQLQDALLESRDSEPASESPLLFGSCQRLQVQSVKNVRQRQTAKGTIVTTIDVKVQSGTIVDQEELITVQVESTQKADRSSFDMKLITFNRISHYSIYEQCADPGLPTSLCICNEREASTKIPEQDSTIYDIVSAESHVQKLKPCLLVVKRTYRENEGEDDYVGVEVYEIANICNNKKFSISIGAETRNVRASTELPIEVKLPPRTIYFASVMMNEVGYIDAKLNLKFHVVSEDLEERKTTEKRRQKENKKGSLSGNWKKLKSKTNKSDKEWKEINDK